MQKGMIHHHFNFSSRCHPEINVYFLTPVVVTSNP